MSGTRLFVIARHGQSTLNLERRVNGDPAVPVGLTERGREEARLLGLQLAHVDFDLCVHSRFGRTRETLQIALAGRGVPSLEEPLFDDVDVGELEGETVDSYRAFRRGRPRSAPFPGGESLDDAARRYAAGYRRLLDGPHERVLVVCHEIPLRYALNAADGSGELDGPVHQLQNAQPFLFSGQALARAAERIARLAGPG